MMKYDEIVEQYIGEFGFYQKTRYFLVCLPLLLVSIHTMSFTFTGDTLPHRCRFVDESETEDTIEQFNETWQCARPETSFQTTTCDDGWIYNHSRVVNSAVNRWNLVCSRSWLRAFTQSMYYVGYAAGCVFFGVLGDRCGRKPAFIIAITLQCVSGLLSAFVPWFWAFVVLRFVNGFGHPGVVLISFVIGMELVGPSKRYLSGVASLVLIGLGQALLGGLAYFIRDYRYLQLTISLPYVLFFSYWWLIPESVRWLLSKGRHQAADKCLRAAAHGNKRDLPVNWIELIKQPDTTSQSAAAMQQPNSTSQSAATITIADLFRNPTMRIRTLCVFFLWFAGNLTYYGIGMNPAFLGGDPYLTFVLSGLADLPGAALVVPVNFFGRKILVLLSFSASFICLVIPLAVPALSGSVTILITKTFISIGCVVLYIYTAELFPTPVRSISLGMCSMIARIGTFVASYFVLWLVDYSKEAVVATFAATALLGAALVLFLPETTGGVFPETMEDSLSHPAWRKPTCKMMKRTQTHPAEMADCRNFSVGHF